MAAPKRVLIIGAGVSGLTAIKACLEEGQIPVCVEKTGDIGGLWNYKDSAPAPGTAGIYHSLVINTSREMMAFSDFPIPDHFPHFMSHAHVLAYLRLYAQRFNLLPYIRFNTEVRHVHKAHDYDDSGRWSVTYVKHVSEACCMKCVNEDYTDEACDVKNELIHEMNQSRYSKNSVEGGSCTQGHRRVNCGEDKTCAQSNEGTDPTTEIKAQVQGHEGIDTGDGDTETNCNRGTGPSSEMRPETATEVQGHQRTGTSENTAVCCHQGTETGSETYPETTTGTDTQIEDNQGIGTADADAEVQRHRGTGSDSEISSETTTEIKVSVQGHQGTDIGKDKTGTHCHQGTDTGGGDTGVHCYQGRETGGETYPETTAKGTERVGCREVTEDFDGVMVCSGHHTVPYVPALPGSAHFQGTILHSQLYKRPQPFAQRRVLVIGIGNSAVDIASDLAKTAQKVFISTRRGSWVVSRTALWGVPADMLANSRVMFSLPLRLLQWCVEKQANLRMDHDHLGLTPAHRLLGAHPTINDELPFHLMTERVVVRPDVSRILPHGVQFADGTTEEVDVIIMATGYDYRLDFVDPDVLKVVNNHIQLFKYVFPPHLPHATLAVIGLVQPIGAIMPISELQSRWFVNLILGRVHLPDREQMERDVQRKEQLMDNRYYKTRRHTLQAFWIQLMDEVAEEIGARPNLWRMLFTSPGLALRCFLGPCLPAQYRLQGPKPWPEAATFIRELWTRFAKKPSTTRDPRSQGHSAGRKPTVLEENTLHNPTRTERDNARTDSTLPSTGDVGSSVTSARRRMTSLPMTPSASSPPTASSASSLPAVEADDLDGGNGRTTKGWGRLRSWRCRAYYSYLLLLALCCLLWLCGQLIHSKQLLLPQ